MGIGLFIAAGLQIAQSASAYSLAKQQQALQSHAIRFSALRSEYDLAQRQLDNEIANTRAIAQARVRAAQYGVGGGAALQAARARLFFDYERDSERFLAARNVLQGQTAGQYAGVKLQERQSAANLFFSLGRIGTGIYANIKRRGNNE